LTAAIVGCGSEWIFRNPAWARAIISAGAPWISPNEDVSIPLENDRPSPLTTTHRTSPDAAISSAARASPSNTAQFIAFKTSGRRNVITARRFSKVTSTVIASTSCRTGSVGRVA
jgi:hypothetical protein